MLKNFFTIALRNCWRNKTTSLIHVLGLAIGIATFLLILLFIQHERSYDRFNKKADQIVRVVFHGQMNGGDIREATVMPPVGAAMKHDFPEVQAATRLVNQGFRRITYGDKTLREDAMAFVDSNFFQVFTLPLIEGDVRTALLQPNSVVITKAVARKFFGNEDPIGKVLEFRDDSAAMTVTGLIDKVPENSHFHFELFGSMAGYADARSGSWMTSGYYTYLVLPAGYDNKKLEAKLPAMVDRYMGPQLQASLGVTLGQFRANGNNLGFELQRLTDIHLHSHLAGELQPPGDIRYLYIFGAVGAFMLLIACINFINLSTAGAGKRAREVGIRKVLGSVRIQLIGQFLIESLLLTLAGTAIAIGLIYFSLPLFNQVTGQELALNWSGAVWLLPTILCIILVTGILAGLYPAFFLSAFNPVTVLKGLFTPGGKSAGLRSVLVTFQFFISICLIIGTAIVYQQLSYIQHKKLGYDRDHVLIVQESYWLGKNQDYFRRQLLQDPRIVSISSSAYLPAGQSNNSIFIFYPDGLKDQLVYSSQYRVDEQYIPTLGMQVIAGRNFSRDFPSDSNAALINETAAIRMGWITPGRPYDPAEILKHFVTQKDNNGTGISYHVIGMIRDFNFRSLHDLITPLIMTFNPGMEGDLIIKTRTTDLVGLISTIGKHWAALKPAMPFSYTFLDDRFNNTYKFEQHIGLTLGIFAGLTIFVACLGLFGLATFVAERRTKEIGIRKVLGASSANIITLLSKEFVRLVVIAFLIAAPVAWLVMNRWLRDFAYRITIGWWVFVLAALLALLITLLTVGVRALRAAVSNPVDSLRSE
jgi:putative ABC transport system permease protein